MEFPKNTFLKHLPKEQKLKIYKSIARIRRATRKAKEALPAVTDELKKIQIK